MPVKRSVKAKQQAAPKVTPANQWRKQPHTGLVTLPSGNTARLRKVTLVEIATTGKLPEPLSDPKRMEAFCRCSSHTSVASNW